MTPFDLQTSARARPNILTRAIDSQEQVRDSVCQRLRVPVKDRESEHVHSEDKSGGGRSYEARHIDNKCTERAAKQDGTNGVCEEGGGEEAGQSRLNWHADEDIAWFCAAIAPKSFTCS
eukprot:CAMPEP_0177767730 /NCGR_PEP_ID=MMETSP0491_2-20121128/9299_1 /TAXON_ID=63592 /ORGANISM="Tetraselmis chuii, Strain PLY429" /LENGTH=118 /DNA_ID=CAMNT_0019284401 /DNA_START=370 /DNA_END=724 /DNA_ORIENTATION=-